MKVVVVGAGYVGLVTGVCLSDFGNKVQVVDINAHRVDMLNQGKTPIFEPGIEPIIERNLKSGRLSFSIDLDGAIQESEYIFIAVSTPSSESGDADLSYLFAAVDQISAGLLAYPSASPRVVVVKSTVPVGTCAAVQARFEAAGLGPDQCVVVSNPEFLREGSAIGDCMNPDRVVIGCRTPQGLELLQQLYHPYVVREIPFVLVSLEAAEHIKYASNAFLATKISFVNELALLCEKTGTDVLEVARGIGLDPRIGGSFLMPGPGFGGSCFPKDIAAMAAVARHHDLEFKLIDAVEAVNVRQKMHVVDNVMSAVAPISNPIVGVLGLAFKANTDDMRAAPALDILPALVSKGCTVKAYDPVAVPNARRLLGDQIAYMASASEAITGVDAILVLTEWNEFFDLDLPAFRQLVRTPMMVDARRIVDATLATQAGFTYYGIGKG